MNANDLPQDIRLWLLAAGKDTGVLEQDVPLPMAHDAIKRGLVREASGDWVLTVQGRNAIDKLLSKLPMSRRVGQPLT
ncbi:hypothetical protein BEN30_06820 [Magnetovibrio blakemorei]|uniref:Uncharacterized protein n=1 Tax=Magnetovibrio blakemorei TaxID=28181 RepID=A0A1E5Q9I7_9PROT|nr:hypothetical protein BEN30_06820 [Magnetovibrio blakemorei]